MVYMPVPAGGGEHEPALAPPLHPMQALHQFYRARRWIKDKRLPLLAAFALRHPDDALLIDPENIIPAKRRQFRPAQAGIHQQVNNHSVPHADVALCRRPRPSAARRSAPD